MGFRPKLGQDVAPMAVDLLDQIGSTMSNLQLKRYATMANPDGLFISQALRHQATAVSFYSRSLVICWWWLLLFFFNLCLF